MIFAEVRYDGHYDHQHAPILALLARHFRQVESGHQSDSYVWVLDGAQKVSVDTFTSMTHQVKCAVPGKHVEDVIAVLQTRFAVRRVDPPEPEAHEDG